MDQYVNNRENQFLYNVIANPAANGEVYSQHLQDLAARFPQSGLLQALLAHSGATQNLAQAAASFDNGALHKLMTDSSALPAIEAGQIFKQPATVALKAKGSPAFAEPQTAETQLEQLIPVEESEYPEIVSTEVEAFEPVIADSVIAGPDAIAQTEREHDNVVFEDHLPQDIDGEDELPEANDGIEDEVYDEILGFEHISIGQKEQQSAATAPIYESAEETEFLEHEAEEAALAAQAGQKPVENPARGLNFSDEADKLIAGNIAATDYFMFDSRFAKAEAPAGTSTEPQPEIPNVADDDAPNVSRYHDEKMPYSFLWWLDKTRQEHAGIYQPYTRATNPVQPQAEEYSIATNDALQQQYFENIFHLTSVEDLDKHTAQNVEFAVVPHKGDDIIERFIKEEPQIKPPSAAALDTENKAKASAIDQGDLVTETLASIYADQMLYHKAIAIYRKLILKFPEKSRYFADRIENLEKKTN